MTDAGERFSVREPSRAARRPVVWLVDWPSQCPIGCPIGCPVGYLHRPGPRQVLSADAALEPTALTFRQPTPDTETLIVAERVFRHSLRTAQVARSASLRGSTLPFPEEASGSV